jgi:hypothetical protein
VSTVAGHGIDTTPERNSRAPPPPRFLAQIEGSCSFTGSRRTPSTTRRGRITDVDGFHRRRNGRSHGDVFLAAAQLGVRQSWRLWMWGAIEGKDRAWSSPICTPRASGGSSSEDSATVAGFSARSLKTALTKPTHASVRW